MSNFRTNSETRSDVILRHTQDAIDAKVLTIFPFSKQVAERYLAMTPERSRAVGFKEVGSMADQALPAEKHNHKLVVRYFNRDTKTFPTDIEEAWMLSMPQPYQHRCRVELAARSGHLLVRSPLEDAAGEQVSDLADLLREVGETAMAAAPIFADGKVTKCDAPHLPAARAEIRQLMAVAAQLYYRLAAVDCGADVDEVIDDKVTPLQGRARA